MASGRRAGAREIAEAGETLGGPLPAALAELLSETDGVDGEQGLGLIWPLRRIVGDNRSFRTKFRDAYMPFDSLLFFADAGNGDQFALVVQPARDGVFAWDHENDSRRWVAPDIERYLDWWLSGRLTL